MRRTSVLLVLAAGTAIPTAIASPATGLCDVLHAFVSSVPPGQTREFTYRASWGANFKDAAESALSAKRCEHGGYVPAEKVCAYLMEHGSAEFVERNVMSAVACLSPDTRFAPRLVLNTVDLSLTVETRGRGWLVDVMLKEDPAVGGMMFRLAADGY